MANVYEISLLLDFYGQMLTAKQYDILDMHYNNDYSLGELAEHLNISRQGVYDNIKRGRATLDQLEQKLGLVRKFTEQKAKAEEILGYIKGIDSRCLCDKDRQSLKKIEEGIMEIINKI